MNDNSMGRKLPNLRAQTYFMPVLGSELSRQSVNRSIQLSLSVALLLGLSGYSQAADNIDAAKDAYERLQANAGSEPLTQAQRQARAELFLECQQVSTDAARLACYDKVAGLGQAPSFVESKKPLDLAKTFQTTLAGKPQVVLSGNDILAPSSSESIEESGATNNLRSMAQVSTDQAEDDSQLNRSEPTNAEPQYKDEKQILAEIGVTQSEIEKYTPLSLAYDLDKNNERGTWTARPHRPMYLLPIYTSLSPNRDPDTPNQEKVSYSNNEIRASELKLQVSVKTKVAEDLFGTNADMWFGYTQQSHWQVYNEDNSRPFRATDYEPEIFLTQPVTANLPLGGRLRMLGVGAVHHSNGQSDPLSRSWNRLYLMGGAEWGRLSVIPRLWARVNTDTSSKPDDNPDITDFMGYGDVTFLYDFENHKTLGGTLRYNPSTNKGALQLDYIHPLANNINGYIQIFQGYGESIIDYNHENTGIGVGVVLNDWKGF
ncbi:MAG: phospholipase A [Psychrobacter sp.]|nr:phospholipase A [Psychrobacter sp.]